MARLGPLFDPKNPHQKVYVGPFLASFSREWGTYIFLWAQNEVFWVGAKKFMLKKFMCFLGPLQCTIKPRWAILQSAPTELPTGLLSFQQLSRELITDIQRPLNYLR